MTPFRISPYTLLDKSITVAGPDYLLLRVDFDDVDHDQVSVDTERMVKILNEHWGKAIAANVTTAEWDGL